MSDIKSVVYFHVCSFAYIVNLKLQYYIKFNLYIPIVLDLICKVTFIEGQFNLIATLPVLFFGLDSVTFVSWIAIQPLKIVGCVGT